jgi:hypothetical protein
MQVESSGSYALSFEAKKKVELHSSCQDIFEAGTTASGEYNIMYKGAQKKVWCDMSDGGGWMQVAEIDGNDQYHSDVNAVGDGKNGVVKGGINTAKYSDEFIKDQIGKMPDGRAEIKFKCKDKTVFFKGCTWSATRGLPSSNTPCVDTY